LWLELFGSIGSFASVLGLLLSLRDAWPWWAWFVLLLGVALLVISVVASFSRISNRHTYAKQDAAGIGKYMYEWIRHGGRVVIWTRDHSWANNPEMESLLLFKAGQRELIVCMPVATPFALRLEQAGAELHLYGGSASLPSSRFTIVQYGRDGACVAVGRQIGNAHVIDEFAAGEHPAFHMAHDLMRLAERDRLDSK
jgi:hypothetical protein